MTAAPVAVPDIGGAGLAAAGRELVAAMLAAPAGTVSPSVYETGRLVADAPWLPGHAERLRHLLATQRVDGGWGAPGAYGLVPTLSAVEALLSALRTPGRADAREAHRLSPAVHRGVAALRERLLVATEPVPDMPGVDLIVPALIDRIDALLGGGAVGQGTRPSSALPMPYGMTRHRAEAVGRLLATGGPVPEKLWHAFEVLDGRARAHPRVRPVSGAVGASPAATAAWLGDPARPGADRAALAYLTGAVARGGGPVPCTTPIAVFERAWVLSGLARVGAAADVPAELTDALAAALGPTGAATSPGLPTDADTTAVTLFALARLGHPVAPDSLLAYDTGAHFCTWQGEDGASVTTNAHVLEALGWHARHRPGRPYADVAGRVAGWLVDGQLADGSWTDRWHASPYYATASVAVSLAEYAPDATAGRLDRAADWVRGTQRDDGSWGLWSGTPEETAYALQVLLGTGRAPRPDLVPVVRRALAYLDEHRDGTDHGVPLWHDKDLYQPVLIVRAAVLAARHLVRLTGHEGR
ncbi:prenyltransferase/squalene oxidase repeat-containing protein [Micromonospora sp. CPCC 205546]|uniref:prenyltransferase/squalene oxidase repeat-containing protein n=1 Tax=Micromonospora sp. CPCC 205546 TaxID=3122397 RepID=UPI002FF1564D